MIVDDSAVVRQTLKEVLESDPNIEVSAVAPDPLFALKKIETERPDVIASDVEMPRMDGITFLKNIMSGGDPIPVVICSSKTEAGSENAIKALEFGARRQSFKAEVGTKQFLEESKVYICDVVKGRSAITAEASSPRV
jgi:two-component system chemotaxis response regulator CheB